MGKISQGIQGGFSGKVGKVVDGSWQGIDYMRGIATSIANSKAAVQVQQRTKFSITLTLLQSMTGFLHIGFCFCVSG